MVEAATAGLELQEAFPDQQDVMCTPELCLPSPADCWPDEVDVWAAGC